MKPITSSYYIDQENSISTCFEISDESHELA